MKQEDKDLLFKDISARLPYRTMVKCITDYHHEFDEELSDIHIMNFYQFDVKPYLRPMSSMTEEEREYIEDKCAFTTIGPIGGKFCLAIPVVAAEWLIDFYNSNHLDYRGLIEKGFALEAPKGMYN